MDFSKIDSLFNINDDIKVETLFNNSSLDLTNNIKTIYNSDSYKNALKNCNSSKEVIQVTISAFEEFYKPKNIEEYFTILYFIGFNTQLILQNFATSKFKKDIKSKSSSFLNTQNIRVGSLDDFMNFLRKELSSENNQRNSRVSKYSYKITETSLIITDEMDENDKSVMSVTNNIESVINEIITKESFESISTLRIFTKGTDNSVSEIKPTYIDKGCITCKFEIIN